MKRILIFFVLSIIGITYSSCKSDDDEVQYSKVYDIRNVNFELIDGVFTVSRTLDNPIPDSDVMLIYMQNGITNNGFPIWQQLPITYYFEDGHEVDYSFDFSAFDFQIYAGATFNLTGTEYIINRTFRVVLVPASFGKGTDNQVDYNDYESVINYYNIDDTNVGSL